MKRRFVSRAVHDAVCADRDRLRRERDGALQDAAASSSATKTMARQNVLLSQQIEERERRIRDLTARLAEHDVPADVAALKQQLADAEARCARLQTDLDHALGLDDPKVEDGKGWQARREQKMRYDK